MKQLSNGSFLQAAGVSPLILSTMVEVIEEVYLSRKYPGRPSAYQLEASLDYYSEHQMLFCG